MPKTGPQTYPGVSKAYWFQDDYGGDAMEVNVVVLHTTEGRTVPSYGGGSTAPNLTALPDLSAKALRWYQHFDIETSSRALVNLSGGVETNTLNVCQVELVGTCDPATHARWTDAGQAHMYWPEAPGWALAGVADFLKWMQAQHGVPLSGPSRWPAYPTSYANGGGQRMTFSQWNAFKGVCGHMHVPENVHGDPGAIDFPRIIALAEGEDMALSAEDKTWIRATVDDAIADATLALAKAVGKQTVTGDTGMKSPDDDTVVWALSSYVGRTYVATRRLEAAVAAALAQAQANGASLTELKTLVSALDLSGLPEAIAAKLTALRLKLEETV